MPVLSLVLVATLNLQAHHAPKRVDVGHGITVTFPAMPRHLQDPKNADSAIWTAETKDGVYTVDLSPEPDGKKSATRSLEGMTAAGVTELGAKVVSSTPILLNGWKGVAIELRGAGGTTWERIYRVKNVVFELDFSTEKGKFTAAAQDFLASTSIPRTLVGPFRSATEIEASDLAGQVPLDLGDGVKAVFPAKPSLDKQSTFGRSTLWTCTSGVGVFAAEVATPKFMAFSADQTLNATSRSEAAAMGASVVSTTPILLNGWKGVALRLHTTDVEAWERVYCVKGKIYVLLASSALGAVPTGGEAFLGSLSLPKALAGPFHSATEPEENKSQAGPGPTDIGHGITVQFPTAPRSTDIKGKVPVTVWATMSDSGAYIADIGTSSEIATEDEQSGLCEAMFGVLRPRQGTLTSQRDVVLNGWAGIEFQGQIGHGKLWGRAYRVESSIVLVATAGYADAFAGGSRAFFDSITLPKSTPAGPHTAAGPVFKEYDLPDLRTKAQFPAEPNKDVEALDPNQPLNPATFYRSSFGDRLFAVAGGDVPGTASTTATTSHTDAFLAQGSAALAKALNMSVLHQNSSTVKGRRVMVTELRNDSGAARIVFSYAAGHYLIAVAIAPKAIFPSEEVERFFASVTDMK